MNRCDRDGWVVNGETLVPADASERHVDGLDVVGCNRIVCSRCEAVVRNRVGVSFVDGGGSGEGGASVDLEALYELPQLERSPVLAKSDKGFRLYFCRCERFGERFKHALDDANPDPATDPPAVWACGGHPAAKVAREEVDAAFGRGGVDDAVRAWARMGDDDARIVVDAAIAALRATDPAVRERAIGFFYLVPDERGLMFIADETETAWRALTPILGRAGKAQTRARAAATATGKGGRKLYYALAKADGVWFAANADAIATANPAGRDDLLDSLTQLPATVDAALVRDRIRVALAGAATPDGLDAFVERVRNAPRKGRAAPFCGEMTPVAGAIVELEFRGEHPDVRFVDVIVGAGERKRAQLATGTLADVVAALTEPTIRRRIAEVATKLAQP